VEGAGEGKRSKAANVGRGMKEGKKEERILNLIKLSGIAVETERREMRTKMTVV
jgi:hypothetical protein